MATQRRKYPLPVNQADEVPIHQHVAKPHRRKRVYVWGNAKTGALGIPQSKKRENMDRVDHLACPKRFGFAEKYNVSVIACGYGYSLFGAIDSDHLVYGTGLNSDSQIGYHDVRHDSPLGVLLQPRPMHLPLGNASRVSHISGGRAHAAILTSPDGLFMIGNNAYGQCGRRIIDGEQYEGSKLIQVFQDLDGEKIAQVECGQDHTLALTDSGKVFSCGWGADGQTGLGHYNTTSKFTLVGADILGERIVKLSCKADFVLAINDRGELFGWGNTEYSQISCADGSQQVCNPRAIKLNPEMGKIVDIAAGGSFCMLLNEYGDVYVWGFGILGLAPSVQSSIVPCIIPPTLFGRNEFNPSCRVAQITCGLSHLAAITDSGDLYMWGRNRSCCLGLGNDTDQYFPLKVCLCFLDCCV